MLIPAHKRHPVTQYFADIWAGIVTTYVGMGVTLTYLFRKPVTMRYPETQPVIPPGHRGLHDYVEPKCILCFRCQNVCPVGCIRIETLGRGKDALLTGYSVDYSKCLYCNMCAEICPTNCVWLTERYNLACGSRQDCVLQFARPKTEAEITEHKALLAQREAERKARQAQKEAERKAQQQPQGEQSS